MAAIGAQTIGAVNPGSTCNPGGIAPSPVILDPVAQHLPASCFTTALASKDNLPTSSATTGTLTPGIYTNPINNATLEPGIYILEGGIAGGGITQTVPSSADPWYQVLNQHTPGSGAGNYDANAGVLMYLPGTASTDQTAGCVEASALPQVSLSPPPSGGITVNPLDSNQSQYWISGNPNLGDMWMWQDKTNTQPLMIQGNIGVTTLAASAPAACNVSGVGNVAGLAYLPGASLVTGNGTESIVTGRLIVGGVQLGGTPNITLSGC